MGRVVIFWLLIFSFIPVWPREHNYIIFILKSMLRCALWNGMSATVCFPLLSHLCLDWSSTFLWMHSSHNYFLVINILLFFYCLDMSIWYKLLFFIFITTLILLTLIWYKLTFFITILTLCITILPLFFFYFHVFEFCTYIFWAPRDSAILIVFYS